MSYKTDPDDSTKLPFAGFSPTDKQKAAMAWEFSPLVGQNETVAAGDGGGSATALNVSKLVSFVTTATDSTHVSLANGTITGQIKKIVHKTRSNSQDLVITPANFAAGATMTSNLGGRGIELIWDGANWQILGDVAEFVIG